MWSLACCASRGGAGVAELNLRWPNWIGVVVRDMDAQRRFYREILGLRELKAGEDWVWFDMGSGRLLELLALSPSQPQCDEPRFQTGFVVEDIHEAVKEMVTRGVEQITDVEGGPRVAPVLVLFPR